MYYQVVGVQKLVTEKYAIFVENMERKNNSSIKSASMSKNGIKNNFQKETWNILTFWLAFNNNKN